MMHYILTTKKFHYSKTNGSGLLALPYFYLLKPGMTKTIALFLAYFLCGLWLAAQDHRLPLWPAGKLPNHKDAGEKEVRDTANIVRYRLVQQPDIAVFLPSKPNATGQAVVVCPGGGYGMLAYDWEGTDVARWLSAKGIAAIVLKYRLPNAKSNIVPHQSPLMDAQRAIRMVRANPTTAPPGINDERG